MEKTASARALALLGRGDIVAAGEIIEEGLRKFPMDPGFLHARGRLLIMKEQAAEAVETLQAALSADRSNVEIAYSLAIALRSLGTIKGTARARDILLDIVQRHPDEPRFLRSAAEFCGSGAPAKAVELWKRLIALGLGDADVYYKMSVQMTDVDRQVEANEAIRMAAALAPERYGKLLKGSDLADEEKKKAPRRILRARYPSTEAIQSDLKGTIKRDLMAHLKDVPRFITRNTAFFTMGSCFAWTIAKAFSKLGYHATGMTMSEQINTTYANRYFVDWLEDSLQDPDLAERISEMLPAGFSKNSIVREIREANVFVLTLGVAAVYFDRRTGAFSLPKATELNSRSLTERYEFRTTTVAENVANIDHYVSYIFRLNPSARVVITVSPVPLRVSFEYASAVIADCLSKSTLRIAASEIVRKYEGTGRLHYFPSFEVFRWLGPHLPVAVYGTDDGASWHVSDDIVNTVVESFIESLSNEGSAQGADSRTSGVATALTSPLFSPAMLDRTTPTYFYGSGEMGRSLCAAMDESGPWNFKGFVDSYNAGTCCGHPVFDLGQFRYRFVAGDRVVITSGALAEIAQTLAGLGVAGVLDANPWWRARSVVGAPG